MVGSVRAPDRSLGGPGRSPGPHRPRLIVTFSFVTCILGASALAGMTGGCALENRTGAAAATALARGPVRAWAAQRSLELLAAALSLDEAVRTQPAPDLVAARAAWQEARLIYDEVQPVSLAAAPELDLLLDGRFDNPLTQSGLRVLERALFASPPASGDELLRLAAALRDGAVRLPQALGDPQRTLDAGALLSTMSALVAVVATKADGSDSPFSGTAHLSIQRNLDGLRAIYLPLSPLVQAADVALDDTVRGALDELSAQVRGLPSTDALTDKLRFLRRCSTLSQALLDVTRALGLGATTQIDVT